MRSRLGNPRESRTTGGGSLVQEREAPYLPFCVEAERTRLSIPSRIEWIDGTVQFLAQKAILCGVCDEKLAYKVSLALHEALTNSVVHGNLEISSDLKELGGTVFAETLARRSADPRFAARQVDIVIEYDGEMCTWSFTDQGRGFDYTKLLHIADETEAEVEEDPEAEYLLPSGRGIIMMRSFMDDVHYELGGRRVVLTLKHSSAHDRRRHLRVPFQEKVRVAPMRADGSVDWDAAYQAISQDLSHEGMAFIQSQLMSFERIIIELEGGGKPIYIPAEVCHCQASGEGMIQVGCRFDRNIGVEGRDPKTREARSQVESLTGTIQTLIDQLGAEQLEPDERRDQSRFVYTERIGIVLNAEADATFVFARDLSKSGIAFISTTPMPMSEIEIHLPQLNGKNLIVRGEVVRCKQISEGFHDVGARFLSLN